MEDENHLKQTQEKLEKHPKAGTNLLCHIFFIWQMGVIIKNWRKKLNHNLYETLQEYDSEILGNKFEQIWEDEINFCKKPSLIRALLKLYGKKFIFHGLAFFPIETCYIIGEPFLVLKILESTKPNQQTTSYKWACIYASSLILLEILYILFYHFTTMELTILGMKIRVACSSLIYRKCLKMNQSSLQSITRGKLINLLSNDVNKFETLFASLHSLWTTPINCILAFLYISFMFGYAGLCGVVALFGYLLVQSFLTRRLKKIRDSSIQKTDQRVCLINDLICGIQAIKFYTWEKPFQDLILQTRKSELEKLSKANHIRFVTNIFRLYVTKPCVFLSILIPVLNGLPLTSGYYYGLYMIYDSLKMLISQMFQYSANLLAEALIAIRRIEIFLLEENHNNLNNTNCILKSKTDLNSPQEPHINLKNVTVKWNQNSKLSILQNVNFEVKSGELIGVIGPAGSGKSTLLQVIMNEIQIKRLLDIAGTISYASQDSWIFPASVKQNIIFGEHFDASKYNKVLEICCLKRDLELLPHGDETLVGERGCKLSGGQKARINLARAVYKDSDIYLLDDPLSAVDSNVAQKISNDCIRDYLFKKIVILVTHQVHFLKGADRIFNLEAGTMTEINQNDLIFRKLSFKQKNQEEDKIYKNYKLQNEIQEHSGSTSNTLKIYYEYTKSIKNYPLIFFVIFLYISTQSLITLSDFFFVFWINIEENYINLSSTLTGVFTRNNCLIIASLLIISIIITSHCAVRIFVSCCKRASRNLHCRMLTNIIYSPMTFFSLHPSGRILNRFTKDLASIDELIPTCLFSILIYITILLGVFVTVGYSNPFMIIPAVILLVLTLGYQRIFQITSLNLKRSEAITRSTLYTYLSNTITGLSTIRALNKQAKIIQEFDYHQNLNASVLYLFTATFSAFCFWIDLTSLCFVCIVIFSILILQLDLSNANAGLVIIQGVVFMRVIRVFLKSIGELESQIVSVERVLQYGKLNSEDDSGIEIPPVNWPQNGVIIFSNVSLKYSQLNHPVLKNIDLSIKPNEKIGIIGRTGAGKSSIISVLFRLFPFDGIIKIDDVDTKTIPLEALRSKISIIPQEPILFLGSLRKNLDPFNSYSDAEIWKILEILKLNQLVAGLPSGLEFYVTEKGSNFSVGQRQLFCLVRALLKKNKVIVLDEATANIDLQTDELIQRTIQNEFRDCTVLTIAHRLNTVIESDRILVLDDGIVVEFGKPYELIQNQGFFYNYLQTSDKNLLEKIKQPTVK